MPTIKEEEEERKPITYQETFGIRFCLSARQSVAETNDVLIYYDDIYYDDEKVYLSTKTRKAFNGRQEKRCAGKLESTRNFAQVVKKTAKIIATCAGLATILQAPEKDLEERKPTKSDLRITTNNLRAKRAYKIQQACACICDKAILKSVGCNCI